MTTFHSSSAVSLDNVDYRDNAICLVSNVAQMLKNIPQAILMEEYVVVLVLKGHATIQVEGEEFQLSPGPPVYLPAAGLAQARYGQYGH